VERIHPHVHSAGGAKRYILKTYTAEGAKRYILYVHTAYVLIPHFHISCGAKRYILHVRYCGNFKGINCGKILSKYWNVGVGPLVLKYRNAENLVRHDHWTQLNGAGRGGGKARQGMILR